jgi:hypothetical protein
MSAQSGTLSKGGGPVTIRIRPAIVVGAGLLAVGLVAGIAIGRARTSVVGTGSPAKTAVSRPAENAVGSAQTVPELSRRDDYATRHLSEFGVTVPTLSYADDYATRHLPPPSPPPLSYRDDEATRHIGNSSRISR